MLKIAKYPDIILRRRALSVSKGEFNDDLKKLAKDMAQAMYDDDGIGLAAPQISKSIRLLVIGTEGKGYKAYINPEITFFSKDKVTNEEGCLSLPQIFGNVTRPKKIHVKFQNLDGQTQKEKLKGMEAIVLQHEIDHLNGILFIDRTNDITQGHAILDSLKQKLDEQIKS